MPTPQRRSAMPRKSASQMVDVRSLRSSVGTTRGSTSIVSDFGSPGDSGGRSSQNSDQPSRISELSSSTKRQAGARTPRSVGGSRDSEDGQASARHSPEHWSQVFFGNTQSYAEGEHHAWEDQNDVRWTASNSTCQNSDGGDGAARDLRNQLGGGVEGMNNTNDGEDQRES